jgi:DNA-binding NarL/FixJ family response regulator
VRRLCHACGPGDNTGCAAMVSGMANNCFPMTELLATADTARLLPLVQAMLADVPIGLVLVGADGIALWFNEEASVVCSVWNGRPQGGDALPLDCSGFVLPEVLRTACRSSIKTLVVTGEIPPPLSVAEPERGLYAVVRVQLPADGSDPVCYLRLDYRRPRGDRHRELSRSALNLLARLSFREREVALRVREGLTTPEIAQALHRSPLTIKTQLASIFRKLGAKNRVHVATLLNE